jgi:hypothetical protein
LINLDLLRQALTHRLRRESLGTSTTEKTRILQLGSSNRVGYLANSKGGKWRKLHEEICSRLLLPVVFLRLWV